MRFHDRLEAGQLLSRALDKYHDGPVVVYALPRGGVALGVEVARSLNAPLDLVIPRKIGHPANPEYAVCAVTENGLLVCNERALVGIDQDWLEGSVRAQMAEAQRRRGTYLPKWSPLPVTGKTAILVDDGVATGLTMLAAILDVRLRCPARVVVAVPVLPRDAAKQLREYIDELVALEIPAVYLGAVGAYYNRFEPVEDSEVMDMLTAVK